MTGTVGHLTRRTINKRRLYLSLQELTCLLLQASAQLISHLYFHIFDSVYNLRRNMHGHAHNMLHIVRTWGHVPTWRAMVHTYIFISHLYHLIVVNSFYCASILMLRCTHDARSRSGAHVRALQTHRHTARGGGAASSIPSTPRYLVRREREGGLDSER